MKKIRLLLISLISIFVFNTDVFAASCSLSVSSENVYVGDRFTVTANVNDAAAWNIHVSANGPVSGCVINQADTTVDAMNTNKTFSATCTAIGTGKVTLRLSGDVTSATDGNAIEVFGSRNVSVSQRPQKPSNNNNNNNSGNNNTPTNNNSDNNDNKSQNNKLKELSIEGYKLEKVDENNYTLVVPNDVTKINVKAVAEDSKSKVTGTGTHEIKVGENNIEVLVVSESGAQNKINIKVTRKDSFYLEDLDSALKSNKNDNINISINSDTKITLQEIEKIKKSKKKVTLNYYNNDKSLMYSWIIDGSKIKDTTDLVTAISYNTENKKEILKLSNYADGLYINFKHSGKLPKGTKIKLYVGNKFDNGSLTNIYYYNSTKKKLEFIKGNVKVKDSYIEFDIEHCSDYFVTMSKINNEKKVVKTPESKNIFKTFTIIELVIILVLITTILIFIKQKSSKNKSIGNTTNNNSDIKEETFQNVNVSMPIPTSVPLPPQNINVNNQGVSEVEVQTVNTNIPTPTPVQNNDVNNPNINVVEVQNINK